MIIPNRDPDLCCIGQTEMASIELSTFTLLLDITCHFYFGEPPSGFADLQIISVDVFKYGG